MDKKASLISKNSLSLPKPYKTKRPPLKKKEDTTISESQIFFCERIMIIIRIMSAQARLIFLMRIFPSQERQFLDPSSPSVNYGNRKPFHVRTLKLLCLSEWLDLISNCKFIKKWRRWYQSVSLFYYKVQHVFQCATIWVALGKWCKQRAHDSTATMSLFLLSGLSKRLKKIYNSNLHSISRTVRIQEPSKTSYIY